MSGPAQRDLMSFTVPRGGRAAIVLGLSFLGFRISRFDFFWPLAMSISFASRLPAAILGQLRLRPTIETPRPAKDGVQTAASSSPNACAIL